MIMAIDQDVQSTPDNLIFSMDQFSNDIMQEGVENLPPEMVNMVSAFRDTISVEDLVVLSLAAVDRLQKKLELDSSEDIPDEDITVEVAQFCLGVICGDLYFENTESEYRLFQRGSSFAPVEDPDECTEDVIYGIVHEKLIDGLVLPSEMLEVYDNIPRDHLIALFVIVTSGLLQTGRWKQIADVPDHLIDEKVLQVVNDYRVGVVYFKKVGQQFRLYGRKKT